MKKVLPVAILAVVGLGAGVLVWWILQEDPEDPPPSPNAGDDSEAIDPARFLEFYDVNGDGIVMLEEFESRYGEAVVKRSNGEVVPAREAFNDWDMDKNGIIDERDLYEVAETPWENFRKATIARGMNPMRWDDGNGKPVFLELNDFQMKIWQREEAAHAKDQIPFADRFFQDKYFEQWARVEFHDGAVAEGFVSNHKGKVWLLKQDATLSVHDPADVVVTPFADAAPIKYVKEIKKTHFTNLTGNLNLIRLLNEWGMASEARQIHARVLLFQPDNRAALDALNLKLDGQHHVPKDG